MHRVSSVLRSRETPRLECPTDDLPHGLREGVPEVDRSRGWGRERSMSPSRATCALAPTGGRTRRQI
eukprot:7572162-Alexandrium_andersonii.AAC.1